MGNGLGAEEEDESVRSDKGFELDVCVVVVVVGDDVADDLGFDDDAEDDPVFESSFENSRWLVLNAASWRDVLYEHDPVVVELDVDVMAARAPARLMSGVDERSSNRVAAGLIAMVDVFERNRPKAMVVDGTSRNEP